MHCVVESKSTCGAKCPNVTPVQAHNVAAEEILARDGSSSSALEPLSTIIRLPEACSSPLQVRKAEIHSRSQTAIR